jgi:hypothetical protein
VNIINNMKGKIGVRPQHWLDRKELVESADFFTYHFGSIRRIGMIVLTVLHVISDPTNPTIDSSLDIPHSAYSIYVSGAYAYMGDGSRLFRILDLSNLWIPMIPRETR